MIVALILKSIDIKHSIIIEDYLQSDGVDGSERIETALDGFGNLHSYLYDDTLIKHFRKQLLQ